MPLYSYKCPDCGEMTDSYNIVDNRHQSPVCECGGMTSLSIQPTQLQPVLGGGDWDGYRCPVTDTFVTSRRKRKYIMDSNNLIETGDRKPSKARAAQTERNRANGVV